MESVTPYMCIGASIIGRVQVYNRISWRIHKHTLFCLAYSMEQNPSWEANRRSASQEIPRLWNPKVHYRIHKCPPPLSIPSHIDQVHASAFDFLKIHLNIVLPSTSGSSKFPLFSMFTHHNLVYTSPLPHTCYMPRPSHSSRFDRPNNIVCNNLLNGAESFLRSSPPLS